LIYCKEASHGRKRDHRASVDTTRAFGDSATVTDAPRVHHPTRVADPRPIADSTANGDGPMMTSNVVRGRPSGGADSSESNQGLLMLEAEERYARERYQLYRAKAYGSRLTSAARLRELERNFQLAEGRLNRARADRAPVVSVDDRYLD
jgi:hypothetical protein